MRPCRKGGVARLEAGAILPLEGLLGMGCDGAVLVVHGVQPHVLAPVVYMCWMR